MTLTKKDTTEYRLTQLRDAVDENKKLIHKAVSELRATDGEKIFVLKQTVRAIEELVNAYDRVDEMICHPRKTEGE